MFYKGELSVLPCKWGCGDTEMKDAFRQGIAHVGDKIDLNLWRQKVFFLGYSREKAETQKQTKMFSWLRFKMKYRIASYFE